MPGWNICAIAQFTDSRRCLVRPVMNIRGYHIFIRIILKILDVCMAAG